MSIDKEEVVDEGCSTQESQSPQKGEVSVASPEPHGDGRKDSSAKKKENKSKEYTEFSVTDTLDAPLRNYMEKKLEIPYCVWRNEMLQADYLLSGDNTHHVALAFENDSLGYNMMMPGSPAKERIFGKNDITMIRGVGEELCVIFRNCIDYFSYKAVTPNDRNSYIILNAPSNIGKVLPALRKYVFWKVDVYMSVSKKGDQCTDAITKAYPYARDCRDLFKSKGVRTYQEFYLSRREQTLF